MEVVPTAEDERFAQQLHQIFRTKPGSGHIASAFALAHLSAVLRAHRPRAVLEIGAGIGTVTRALLEHPCRIERVTAIEDNAFCLEQLDRNIPSEARQRLQILAEAGELDPAETVDLLIVDGNADWEGVATKLREGSVCFVEGTRKTERGLLDEALRRRGLRCPFRQYARGFRMILHYEHPTPGRILLRFPHVSLKKRSIKGCWIGRVEPARSAGS